LQNYGHLTKIGTIWKIFVEIRLLLVVNTLSGDFALSLNLRRNTGYFWTVNTKSFLLLTIVEMSLLLCAF